MPFWQKKWECFGKIIFILKKSGGVLTCIPQIRPRLERNDFICTSIRQDVERLSEDEGGWIDEAEENELEELQTETHIFFYSRE
jgi:hypothetical protein